jgi:hypothetical protein
MTKETLLDTTYTTFWSGSGTALEPERPSIRSLPRDWHTWTPIGPGARRGVARLLGWMDLEDPDAKRIMKNEPYCMEQIATLTAMAPHHGFKMAPHDVQFVLCEFDKYERIKFGQGRTRSRYHPPKE